MPDPTTPSLFGDELLADAAAPAASPPGVPGPDPRLLAAHDIARAALAEITGPDTVGEAQGYLVEPDGVVSLRFATTLRGYPGWFWTVSVAAASGAAPTVLETELLPGDDALLAPEWVPWAVRLAEYRAQQEATAASGHDDAQHEGEPTASGATDDDELDEDDDELDEDDDIDDDLADVDDLDAADFDEDGSPLLHSGDVDGVDIDELDEDASDDDASNNEDGAADGDAIEDASEGPARSDS